MRAISLLVLAACGSKSDPSSRIEPHQSADQGRQAPVPPAVGDNGEPVFASIRDSTSAPWETSTVADVDLRGVAFAGEDPVVVGDDGLVTRRVGGNWKREKFGGELGIVDRDFVAVSATGADAIVALAGSGHTLRLNRGRWVEKSTDVDGLHAIWVRDRDVFFGGDQGIARSSDGGTWIKLDPGIKDPIIALWGTARELYAAGSYGSIVHSSDDGTTWKRVVTTETTLMGPALTAMWGSGPSDVYAVGSAGILHTVDGKTWTTTLIDDSRDGVPMAVWGRGADDVFVVLVLRDSSESFVIHSSDRGTTWTRVQRVAGKRLTSIAGSSSETIVVGQAGFVARTH